jgi:D-glycero-D-manno-heptose 1,7-bisphosphate phosphatase
MKMSSERERPAVFLDRDGTLITERYYLADPDQLEMVAGAVTSLQALQAAGYLLVVVTNQSGIARGLYGVGDFQRVQGRLDAILRAAGVVLDGVYHCPHHPDFTGPCECRKPGSGLFLRAQQDLGIDLGRSAYVGDRLIDVVIGLEFGGLPILVMNGYGAEEKQHAPPGVSIAADLADAARTILKTRAETGLLEGVPNA